MSPAPSGVSGASVNRWSCPRRVVLRSGRGGGTASLCAGSVAGPGVWTERPLVRGSGERVRGELLRASLCESRRATAGRGVSMCSGMAAVSRHTRPWPGWVCRFVPASPQRVDTPDGGRDGCVDAFRHDRDESTHPTGDEIDVPIRSEITVMSRHPPVRARRRILAARTAVPAPCLNLWHPRCAGRPIGARDPAAAPLRGSLASVVRGATSGCQRSPLLPSREKRVRRAARRIDRAPAGDAGRLRSERRRWRGLPRGLNGRWSGRQGNGFAGSASRRG
jgi:hypothetical protein